MPSHFAVVSDKLLILTSFEVSFWFIHWGKFVYLSGMEISIDNWEGCRFEHLDCYEIFAWETTAYTFHKPTNSTSWKFHDFTVLGQNWHIWIDLTEEKASIDSRWAENF